VSSGSGRGSRFRSARRRRSRPARPGARSRPDRTTAAASTARGRLYCWGDNSFDQLGTGDTTPHDAPFPIGTDTDWAGLSINTFHGCARKTDDSLYCWGRNVEGQLGVGDTNLRATPARVPGAAEWIAVSAGRFFSCAAKRDRSVWCTGKNDEGQLGVGDFNRRNILTMLSL
jgi:alpha-tubulin suppressor-like RCC1 family protein